MSRPENQSWPRCWMTKRPASARMYGIDCRLKQKLFTGCIPDSRYSQWWTILNQFRARTWSNYHCRVNCSIFTTRAPVQLERKSLWLKLFSYTAVAWFCAHTKEFQHNAPFSREFLATGNTIGSISPKNAARPDGKGRRY